MPAPAAAPAAPAAPGAAPGAGTGSPMTDTRAASSSRRPCPGSGSLWPPRPTSRPRPRPRRPAVPWGWGWGEGVGHGGKWRSAGRGAGHGATGRPGGHAARGCCEQAAQAKVQSAARSPRPFPFTPCHTPGAVPSGNKTRTARHTPRRQARQAHRDGGGRLRERLAGVCHNAAQRAKAQRGAAVRPPQLHHHQHRRVILLADLCARHSSCRGGEGGPCCGRSCRGCSGRRGLGLLQPGQELGEVQGGLAQALVLPGAGTKRKARMLRRGGAYDNRAEEAGQRGGGRGIRQPCMKGRQGRASASCIQPDTARPGNDGLRAANRAAFGLWRHTPSSRQAGRQPLPRLLERQQRQTSNSPPSPPHHHRDVHIMRG